MKLRSAAALALSAAALVAASGLASPALATSSGAYVKQASYGWPDQCQWFGNQGQVNGAWSSYYCETVIPTNWSAPGLYHLWVQS